MSDMVRRNYLLPRDLWAEVRRHVQQGRFKTESEAVRTSLQRMLDAEAKKAEELTRELDRAAAETARHVSRSKTAGQLVHEAHVEEAHWT